MTFSPSPQNFPHFQRKDQLHTLNISRVIDSEICGCYNVRKFLFQNTIPEATCSRVLNAAEVTIAEHFSQILINLRHISLGNISVSQI